MVPCATFTFAATSTQPMGLLDIAAIIPCYNGASFLDGAIRSVLSQSRPVSEIVVVDDASTDDSAAIADAYRVAGHPVRFLRMERNGGPATARNAGIAAVSAPLVAFLDADDRWEEHHCRSLSSLLERHPHASLAFGLVRPTDLDSGSGIAGLVPGGVGEPRTMLEDLLFDNLVPQSAVMARREALLSVGGYTDGLRYSEDYDLWLRMAHGQQFVCSGEASCVRGTHPGQATHHSLKMYQGAWHARQRYSQFASRAGGEMPAGRYQAICAAAYERDLSWAWQSRSLAVLRGTLALAPLVPGGGAVHRRWALRMATIWPLWRSAAYLWDALPHSWRSAVRARREFGRPAPRLT